MVDKEKPRKNSVGEYKRFEEENDEKTVETQTRKLETQEEKATKPAGRAMGDATCPDLPLDPGQFSPS